MQEKLEKKIWPKKILAKKKIGQKKFGRKKKLAEKKLAGKRLAELKFGWKKMAVKEYWGSLWSKEEDSIKMCLGTYNFNKASLV